MNTLNGYTNLRIGIDYWPPYTYTTIFNQPTGFSTVIVETILAQMRVNMVNGLQFYPWARVESMVRTGELDMIFTGAYSPIRAAVTQYPTVALVTTQWLLFIRRDDIATLHFNNCNDLSGHEIGLVLGYIYPSEFMNCVKTVAEVMYTSTDKQNFLKLYNHRLDYVIAEKHNGLYLIHSLGLQGKLIPLLKNPVATFELYVIFSDQVDPKVVTEFSTLLAKFKLTKSYQLLYDKYLSIKD